MYAGEKSHCLQRPNYPAAIPVQDQLFPWQMWVASQRNNACVFLCMQECRSFRMSQNYRPSALHNKHIQTIVALASIFMFSCSINIAHHYASIFFTLEISVFIKILRIEAVTCFPCFTLNLKQTTNKYFNIMTKIILCYSYLILVSINLTISSAFKWSGRKRLIFILVMISYKYSQIGFEALGDCRFPTSSAYVHCSVKL